MGAKHLDITEVAPTILRKMGSISSCFTHKIPMAPNILPKTLFPKSSSKVSTSNGCKKLLTSWPQQFWEKWAPFRPVLHAKIPTAPKKTFPKNYFSNVLSQKLSTSNGCKTSWHHGPSNSEKNGQHFALFYIQTPKNSSPKIIDVEWVQRIPDIMAPTILRNMGSISPCFTHKPKIIPQKPFPINSSPQCLPKNSSPRSISQNVFPKNAFPTTIDIEWVQKRFDIMAALFYTQTKKYSPKILPQEFFPQNSAPTIINIEWAQKKYWHHGPNNSGKNGQHFALFYTNQILFSQNSSQDPPKILPQIFFNIEWVQKIPAIMAPTILRRMGSISPCFTQTNNYS